MGDPIKEKYGIEDYSNKLFFNLKALNRANKDFPKDLESFAKLTAKQVKELANESIKNMDAKIAQKGGLVSDTLITLVKDTKILTKALVEIKQNIESSDKLFSELQKYAKEIKDFPKNSTEFSKLPASQMNDFADKAIAVMDKRIENVVSKSDQKSLKKLSKTMKMIKSIVVQNSYQKDIKHEQALIVALSKKEAVELKKLPKLTPKTMKIHAETKRKYLQIKTKLAERLSNSTSGLKKASKEFHDNDPKLENTKGISKKIMSVIRSASPFKQRDSKETKSEDIKKLSQKIISVMRSVSPFKQGASAKQPIPNKAKTTGKQQNTR